MRRQAMPGAASERTAMCLSREWVQGGEEQALFQGVRDVELRVAPDVFDGAWGEQEHGAAVRGSSNARADHVVVEVGGEQAER